MVQCRHEVYIDDGESAQEAAGREELAHFRQDPQRDFTNPTESNVTQPGTMRRTTITSDSLIENGPHWKNGRQRGWYIIFDANGETTLVSVQNAGELASLPQDALSANEYSNLIGQENPSLAADLVRFLDEDVAPHTAHHTQGSDKGKRSKLIFASNQLSQLQYQDPQIGLGIQIPPVRRRPRNPATIVGTDNVRW